MTEYAKPWYSSKGVWGGVVTLLAMVLGAFGLALSPEESEQLVLAFTAIGGAVGSVLGIYGRMKATERLR